MRSNNSLFSVMPSLSSYEMAQMIIRELIPLLGIELLAGDLGLKKSSFERILCRPTDHQADVRAIFKLYFVEPTMEDLKKVRKAKRKKRSIKCLGLSCNNIVNSATQHFCTKCMQVRRIHNHSEDVINGAKISDHLSELKGAL